MRLHNRQIKATFWNDPDLLQWPRDKRWFYEGLWQLADDSGCLEDNPFAFKVNLFPSPLDADLTVEALAGWRDELLEQGKLIHYEVTGKQYLFMVNFHKHQTLDKPTPPSRASIPLPPCVEWVEVTNDKGQVSRRQSRYVVRSEVLGRYWTNSGQWPDNVRTSPGLAPVEPEPEPEPELELEIKHMPPSPAGVGVCDDEAPAEKPQSGGAQDEKPGKGREYTPDFEKFWSAYPRREEKKNAFKAWSARIKEGKRAEDIIAASQNYTDYVLAKGTETQFIKQPKTFLGPGDHIAEWLKPPELPDTSTKGGQPYAVKQNPAVPKPPTDFFGRPVRAPSPDV